MKLPPQLRLLFIALLLFISTACAAQQISSQPDSTDLVWYQPDTPASVMSSEFEACRTIADHSTSIVGCMQAKGYLLIPQPEAELLLVRELQEKGLHVSAIAQRLHWSEEKVLRYLDENFHLPHTGSLGRQPVEILTSIGKPAVKPLIVALRDRDSLVRRQAADALGEIGDPRAVKPLLAALKDEDPLVRRHATEALGLIQDPRAVAPLITVLSNRNEVAHVRMSAAEALGRIQDSSAVETLMAALNDEHWNVRSRAAWALGYIKDPRAVECLIAALKDHDATVRGHAAGALGEIKDARAVEPLVAALDDANREVRKRASAALKQVTGKDFGNY